MPTVADIARYLKKFAPTSLAADWDNVGLLLGEGGGPAERVMTCLTVTPEVVREATEQDAGLIVTHHPILFRGAKKLSGDQPEGRLLLPLMRAGVAVYSPHTAFDNAPGGINDILCDHLGLTGVVPLRKRDGQSQYKLVAFVPKSDMRKVSEAVFKAGAGYIGEYSHCSYRLEGTGTFLGSEASNPTVGEAGRLEEADEVRFETAVPPHALEAVLRALRKAHSYEEPAFDVYPLKADVAGGEGRVGVLKPALKLGALARKVKDELSAGAVQVVGEAGRSVKRVAVACGAAGEFLRDAERARADVFLTGEMRFHDYLAAKASGVALLLPGHYATERPAVEELASKLGRDFPDIRAWASRRESDPAKWV